MLAKAADQITVGRVIRDTEGAAMPAECFGATECHCAITHCCQLSGVLGEAVAAFYAVLDRYTLADITKNKDVLSAVLYFHRLPKTAHAL